MLSVVPATLAGVLVTAIAGTVSPLEAPAEWLMEWTPIPIATALLLWFPSIVRPAALLGSFALVLLLGGIAGLVTLPLGGFGAGIASILFLGGLLALGAPLSSLTFVVSGAYGLTLWMLNQRPVEKPGRREMLLESGTIIGGAAALLVLYRMAPLLGAIRPRQLFPYHPPRGFTIPGVSELVTPTEYFYVNDKVLSYPLTMASSWRLTIEGQVGHPLAFNLEALLQRSEGQYVTMECVDNPVGGPLIGTALWQGVVVTELLRLAGATGTVVNFEADDGYTESVPIGVLRHTGALIAVGMNGGVLNRAHGYPARLVVPGLYGFKSVKWVRRLRVVSQDEAGSWATHGWDTMPIIRTTTRIDVAHATPSGILVAGIAFAGLRDITAVQVRKDGGPWVAATLGPRLSHRSWVQWKVLLPGKHGRIEARAIDGEGKMQTKTTHGAYPNGASGWASARV